MGEIMIYINPTVRKSVLNDDNLWNWLERVFKAEYYEGSISTRDVLINSSFCDIDYLEDRTINLHLELMKEIYDTYGKKYDYSPQIKGILNNCNRSKLTVIPSKLMYSNYKDHCRNIEIVPIGINLNKFIPIEDKVSLREKWKLPLNKRIGFWSGNTGDWRGINDMIKYANFNADVYWIFNYYRGERIKWPGRNKSVYYRIDQDSINELLNASDFYLCTNQLGPYYMSDWEAIGAGTKIIDTTTLERELGTEPTREKLITEGWGRNQAEINWKQVLSVYFNI